VFDSRTRRDGPALEILGWFNPLNNEAGKGFKLDEESLKDWVSRGAVPTVPVRSLLTRQGIKMDEFAIAPKTKASRTKVKTPKKRTSKKALKKLAGGAARAKKRATRRAAAEKKKAGAGEKA
jgi:small subunit ribosomal protein S16